MKKQYYILFAILALVLGGGISAWNYTQSFQKLNVSIDQGLQANIYNHNSDTDTYDKPIKIVTGSGSIKLKKGGYAVVFAGTSDYTKSIDVFTLGDSVGSLNIHPDYSDAKQASILKTEEPIIKSVINSAYPTVMKNYEVKSGKLYQRGAWYGAKLVYTGNAFSNTDTYRIILKNNNGTWAIATNPPAISLYAADFPGISKNIVSNVNNVL